MGFLFLLAMLEITKENPVPEGFLRATFCSNFPKVIAKQTSKVTRNTLHLYLIFWKTKNPVSSGAVGFIPLGVRAKPYG